MSEFQYINLDYVELMADGNTEIKKEMFRLLLSETPMELSIIRKAFVEKDWAEIRARSHKMKSTLPFIGNPTLERLNKAIEERAKTETDYDGAKADFEAFDTLYKKVFEEIRAAHDAL